MTRSVLTVLQRKHWNLILTGLCVSGGSWFVFSYHIRWEFLRTVECINECSCFIVCRWGWLTWNHFDGNQHGMLVLENGVVLFLMTIMKRIFDLQLFLLIRWVWFNILIICWTYKNTQIFTSIAVALLYDFHQARYLLSVFIVQYRNLTLIKRFR